MRSNHKFPVGAGICPDILKEREEHIGQYFQGFSAPSSHITIKNNIIYIGEKPLIPSAALSAHKNYIWAYDFQNGGNLGIAVGHLFPTIIFLHPQLDSHCLVAADGVSIEKYQLVRSDISQNS